MALFRVGDAMTLSGKLFQSWTAKMILVGVEGTKYWQESLYKSVIENETFTVVIRVFNKYILRYQVWFDRI